MGEYDTKLTLTNNTKLLIHTLLNSFSIFQHHYPRRESTFMRRVQKQKLVDDTTSKFDLIKSRKYFKCGLWFGGRERETEKLDPQSRITSMDSIVTNIKEVMQCGVSTEVKLAKDSKRNLYIISLYQEKN